MELWTQRITVRFRRNLRFYEQRFQILRHFQDEGDLRDFRVGEEDRVAVRLRDPNHVLGFEPTQVDAAVLTARGDIDRLETGLAYIAAELNPEHIVRPEMSFQWIEPVHGHDYDEARRKVAQAVWKTESSTDFAFLIDGELSDPALTYQVECGIVDEAEIPLRLAGARSGIVSPVHQTAPTLWAEETFPDVAIYAGIMCHLHNGAETPEEVLQAWRRTRDATEQLLSGLMTIFQPVRCLDE